MRCASLAIIGSSGIIAEGLKSLLNGSNFRIKHQHRSLAEFWKSARGGNGYLSGIILDASNHPPLGSSDLDDIRRWSAAVKIVLMADDSRCGEIMPVARDADCVILTSTAGTALLKALELVLLGQRVYPAGLFHSKGAPEIFHDVARTAVVPDCDHTPEPGAENGSRNALLNLSDREVQVVNLLRKGNPNKIIARNLGISEATVKVHVKAILRKTHARNRTEAALLFSSATGPKEGMA
jgi:two-component system nitrate/nitrite response regulator NarL